MVVSLKDCICEARAVMAVILQIFGRPFENALNPSIWCIMYQLFMIEFAKLQASNEDEREGWHELHAILNCYLWARSNISRLEKRGKSHSDAIDFFQELAFRLNCFAHHFAEKWNLLQFSVIPKILAFDENPIKQHKTIRSLGNKDHSLYKQFWAKPDPEIDGILCEGKGKKFCKFAGIILQFLDDTKRQEPELPDDMEIQADVVDPEFYVHCRLLIRECMGD